MPLKLMFWVRSVLVLVVVKLGYTAETLDVHDLPVVPHHLRASLFDSRFVFAFASSRERESSDLQLGILQELCFCSGT